MGPNQLLIRTKCSLVSAGTERMLIEFSKAGWVDKARQQPEKVQEVVNKAFTDGILATFEAVQTKLDQPLPLGYCNVGTVIAVGKNVTGFKVDDLVASNGPHAELSLFLKILCSNTPWC